MTATTTPTVAPQAATSPSGPAPRPVGRRRRSTGSLVGRSVSYAILIALAVVYIMPFLIQVATSFKTDADATANPVSLIPQVWTTAAYTKLFLNSDFPIWFMNSAIVTVFVTLGRVFFDSLAGYALSRLRFRGRTVLFAAFLAVLSVPSVVLLIPRFLVLQQLGLYDTYGGMIIPLLADAAGIFIMKQFFDSIPGSIEEAARIDGAGVFRRFWSVVLPMARPALVTLFILSFQGSWNEFGHFVVSRQSPELNTLTTGVASHVSGQLSSGNQYPLQLAAAVLMTIPVAIIFFIFQRRIMSTTEGGEKG